MKQKIKIFLDRIRETNQKNWLIFGIVLVIVFLFYWWQIRPSQIKSACREVAYLRAKAISLRTNSDTDLYTRYFSTANPPTYKGLNDFLKNRYKNYADLRLQVYDQKDFNTEYSRCLHENGI